MTTPEATDAALQEADRAFARGDFAAVRSIAGGLSRSLDADARKKARSLLAKVSVDPIAIGVWVVSLGFFLLVVFRYVGHGG